MAVDETLKQEVEALRTDLKQIKTDLLGLSKTIGQITMGEAAEKLHDIKQARDQVEDRVRRAAGEAKTTLEEQVKEKPLGTLLVAFGLGLLLGRAALR
jgi:ElaB/YqjD/DUF883 family membrane-anchored ribosome-binding protein